MKKLDYTLAKRQHRIQQAQIKMRERPNCFLKEGGLNWYCIEQHGEGFVIGKGSTPIKAVKNLIKKYPTTAND